MYVIYFHYLYVRNKNNDIMKTAISTKEIEMLQRKQELESKMVKSSKEIEEYKNILEYFKN